MFEKDTLSEKKEKGEKLQKRKRRGENSEKERKEIKTHFLAAEENRQKNAEDHRGQQRGGEGSLRLLRLLALRCLLQADVDLSLYDITGQV